MKNTSHLVFIALIWLVTSLNLQAQKVLVKASETDSTNLGSEESNYFAKMKANLYTLHNAGNQITFKIMAKQIRQTAEAEKSKWIPYYHSAYGYIWSGFLSDDKKEMDSLLNQAQQMIDSANKYSPYNSEIFALQGLLYQARVNVDPVANSQKYAQLAVQNYDSARFMNPENPRPYYLIGQVLWRLPEKLGGNKTNACKHFEMAKEKFETFIPKSEFSPNWGKDANLKLMEECNK
jgi:hypothetical protein